MAPTASLEKLLNEILEAGGIRVLHEIFEDMIEEPFDEDVSLMLDYFDVLDRDEGGRDG